MSRPVCHCMHRHQSYADLAACWNPRAPWISGSGAYAVITDCTPSPMIALYRTHVLACAAMQTACTPGCEGKHRIRQLDVVRQTCVEIDSYVDAC
jgi:hypothetical protein